MGQPPQTVEGRKAKSGVSLRARILSPDYSIKSCLSFQPASLPCRFPHNHVMQFLNSFSASGSITALIYFLFSLCISWRFSSYKSLWDFLCFCCFICLHISFYISKDITYTNFIIFLIALLIPHPNKWI